MKLLIFGNANSPFIIHFTKWIKKVRPNYVIGIFNTSDIYDDKLNTVYDEIVQIFPEKHFNNPTKLTRFKSFYYINKKIKAIPNGKYDVIILHYIFPWYTILSKKLKKKTGKLIAVFWGSDLNRITHLKKRMLNILLRNTDKIILGSPFLFEKINHEFPKYTSKYNISYFGCEPIEKIKHFKDTNTEKIIFKEQLNIKKEKITIALGYNGGKAQQHIKMLKNIKSSMELIEYTDKIHFILPLTYGLNEAYFNEIKKVLLDFNYDYTILTKYMSITESAQLRLATDIFVNLQLTDSFNGTLRESFYAGSIIINGKWLPYQKIKEYGLYFNEIETINELDKKLAYCINNFEQEKEKAFKNQQPIYEITSWSKTIKNWLKVIEQ